MNSFVFPMPVSPRRPSPAARSRKPLPAAGSSGSAAAAPREAAAPDALSALDPAERTIGDWLQYAARQRGSAAAYIDQGHAIAWTAIDAASDQLACGMLGLGLKHGDRIGVIGLNQVEWLQIFYAAMKLGVAVIGMSVRYRDGELEAMAQDAGIKVVFTLTRHEDFDFIAMFQRLVPRLPGLRHVITIDGQGLNSLAGVAGTPLDPGRLSAARRQVRPDDLAMVIYTSGTTGRPKGAGLTHRSLLASASAQARHTRVGDADLLHLGTPLNHVGGITCGVLVHLVGGGTIELVPEFKADRVLEMMARRPPTLVAGVPTMLTLLLMNARIDSVDFSRVRLLFSGGSNVDAVLLERLAARMPHATLMNLYGLSESSGAIVMTPWNAPRDELMATLGKPFAEAQLRIVDAAGNSVRAGEVGELCFKGCGVVPGYIGAAAGSGFSSDGWLQTGDLGTVDARGVITLKGRKKDMYIQGGFNVYPAEVESLLARHPKVALAAVIGVPDPVMGEIGRAYIVPRPDSGLTVAELRAFCAEHLADYKLPRQVELRDELPLTPAGKIHKAALRAEG